MLGLTYVLFLWRFRRKMSRGTYPRGQIHQFIFFFIFLLSSAAASFVTCSPLFPRIESAVPTFKDIRAAVARATWIPDQWLDRESVHSDAQRSKNTLWSWWIKLIRIYVLEHWQMWYEWHSTLKDLSFLSMHSTRVDLLLAFNNLMISVCKFFVAHPLRDFGIWPSLRSERRVENTSGFFVIYGVNTQWMDLSPTQTFIYGI